MAARNNGFIVMALNIAAILEEREREKENSLS